MFVYQNFAPMPVHRKLAINLDYDVSPITLRKGSEIQSKVAYEGSLLYGQPVSEKLGGPIPISVKSPNGLVPGTLDVKLMKESGDTFPTVYVRYDFGNYGGVDWSPTGPAEPKSEYSSSITLGPNTPANTTKVFSISVPNQYADRADIRLVLEESVPSSVFEAGRKQIGVSLSPTPASSFVSVKFNFDGPVTMEIWTPPGQKVRSVDVPAGLNEVRLDLSGLPGGVYYLRGYNHHGDTFTTKLDVVK